MANEIKEAVAEMKPESGDQPASQKTAAIYPDEGLGKNSGFLSFIPKLYSHHKFLTIGLILAIIAGSAAYFLLSHNSSVVKDITVQYDASYYPLPELKLSVKKNEENLSYLVIGLTLKLPGNLKSEDFRKKEPEILDVLHTYFSSITLDSLGSSASKSLVSSVGLERLRQNIIRRLNTILAPLKIESVLFRKLITQ